MSQIVIERFSVKNDTRGKATLVATFNVNLGPMTINGMELIRLDSGVEFVSPPSRNYQIEGGEWRRFNYVHFNEDRGDRLKDAILEAAKDELARAGNPAPARRASGGSSNRRGSSPSAGGRPAPRGRGSYSSPEPSAGRSSGGSSWEPDDDLPF